MHRELRSTSMHGDGYPCWRIARAWVCLTTVYMVCFTPHAVPQAPCCGTDESHTLPPGKTKGAGLSAPHAGAGQRVPVTNSRVVTRASVAAWSTTEHTLHGPLAIHTLEGMVRKAAPIAVTVCTQRHIQETTHPACAHGRSGTVHVAGGLLLTIAAEGVDRGAKLSPAVRYQARERSGEHRRLALVGGCMRTQHTSGNVRAFTRGTAQQQPSSL